MNLRRRLDVELVRRELAPSRAQAGELIAAGLVTVGGAMADKPARLVGSDEPITVISRPRFVSRGGEKLEAALDRFGVDPTGLRCIDVGASTGGFTDCLLQYGADHVVAIDVGTAQLHSRLRRDPRVTSRERLHIRDADAALLGGAAALVVADLSFISLTRVVGPLLALARPGADLIVLVKPQFEAGRREVDRGSGVIRDPSVWGRTVDEVRAAFELAGAAIMGVVVSPRRGASGNVEFLMHVRRDGETTVSPPGDGAETGS